MNCKNCGFPLTNENEKCPSCGTPNEMFSGMQSAEPFQSNTSLGEMPTEAPIIGGSITPNIPNPSPVTMPTFQSEQSSPVEPIQQMQSTMPIYNEGPKDDKNKKIIIIIIAVVAAIAFMGIGFAIGYAVAPKGSAPNVDEPVVEEPTEPEEEKELKTIGEDSFGYVMVLDDWEELQYLYSETDNSIINGIEYILSNSYLLSLYKYEKTGYTSSDYANAAYNTTLAEEPETDVVVESAVVGLDEYAGYVVKKYDSDTDLYLFTYYFDDENGDVHYISIEGPESIDEYTLANLLAIVSTYKLEK